MNELTVRRAVWSEALKAAFHGRFQWEADYKAYETVFTIIHQESPGWQVLVTIKKRGRAVWLYFNSKPFAAYAYASTLDKLLAALEDDRRSYGEEAERKQLAESKAKSWQKRQETELQGCPEFPWMSVSIITSGPHAGRYQVRLEPGNPFERLTLGQFKVFQVFCEQFSGNRPH